MNRILVIDDDIELCELLSEYLQPEGFAVTFAHDGETGAENILNGDYSLVILDIMLPRINGFEVLSRIRAQSRVPVIMLTARGEDVDRIVGLEMGADDYLSKPFNPRELVARIRAVQRRTTSPPEKTGPAASRGQITVEDITLDHRTRRVNQDDLELDLTAVEFSLLEVFLQNLGEVVSREDLVSAVLHRPFSPYDRSIDVHVSNLRKKLGLYPGGHERIKTVRGTGYLYAAPAKRRASA